MQAWAGLGGDNGLQRKAIEEATGLRHLSEAEGMAFLNKPCSR